MTGLDVKAAGIAIQAQRKKRESGRDRVVNRVKTEGVGLPAAEAATRDNCICSRFADTLLGL